MNKGQINIAATLIGLGAAALTMFGLYTAGNVRTDNKIGGVQKEVGAVSERTARLETAVPILQQDIKEIKMEQKRQGELLNQIFQLVK